MANENDNKPGVEEQKLVKSLFFPMAVAIVPIGAFGIYLVLGAVERFATGDINGGLFSVFTLVPVTGVGALVVSVCLKPSKAPARPESEAPEDGEDATE